MRLLAAIALSLLTATTLAHSQRSGGIAFAPAPAFHPPTRNHGVPPVLLLGSPWLTGYSPVVVTPPAQPPVIVIQTQPAPPEPKEERKPITPLLIELRGGQYLRFEGNTSSPTVAPASSPAPRPVNSVRHETKAGRQAPGTTVVLIFRDAHREEVSEYVIADGAIYVHGDYWKDGYWNKKILLSALDLSATVAANQNTEARFVLPTGPHVIVTGP